MRLTTKLNVLSFLLISLSTAGCFNSGGGGDDGTQPSNNAPTADDNTYPSPSTGVSITLTGDDPDGDNFSFTDLSDPLNGELTNIDLDAGTLDYIPDTNFFGTDTFTFSTVDEHGLKSESPGTIDIAVIQGEPPHAEFEWLASAPLTIDVSANGSSDNETPFGELDFGWQWKKGASVDPDDNNATMTHVYDGPDEGPGDYLVTLTVTDGDGMTDTYSEWVTVTNEQNSSGGTGEVIAETNMGSTPHSDILRSAFTTSAGTTYVALNQSVHRYNQAMELGQFMIQVQDGAEVTAIGGNPGFEGASEKVLIAMLHNNAYDLVFGEGQPNETTFDGNGSSNRDIVIARYSDTGYFEAAFHVGGTGWDGVRDMHVLPNGSMLLAIDFRGELDLHGQSFFTGATDTNIVIALFDPNFQLSWATEMDGDDEDTVKAISAKGDYLHITGRIGGYTPNNTVPFVTSLDVATGGIQWVTPMYGGVDVASLPNGGCHVTGVQTATTLNKFGEFINEVQGTPGTSIDVAPDGTFVVAGLTNGQTSFTDWGWMVWTPEYSFGGTDPFLVKVDGEGSITFADQYGTGNDDTANTVTIKPDGSVFLIGTSSQGLFYEVHQSDGGLPLFNPWYHGQEDVFALRID